MVEEDKENKEEEDKKDKEEDREDEKEEEEAEKEEINDVSDVEKDKERESEVLDSEEKSEKDYKEDLVKNNEDNKEKVIEDNEAEADEKVTGEQEKDMDKQLKKIFLVIGFLALIFLGVFLFINSVRHFNYKGIDFDVVKEGELILYRTALPVKHSTGTGKVILTEYNFYLRNDPRKLKDLPFDGEFSLKENLVMNFTENFNCDGDGVIAVANLMNLFNLLKTNVTTDEDSECDPEGGYTFLRLQSGNETSIEQFNTNCYNLNINNCEVLEVTEKYMVEIISELNKIL